ncbi:GNAT family N-acetyltransferase [Clostridium sp.]|uniref:GNAT family N-acetyltransferase n=1 Tax=Clostridium sp. TaxID=1506 RepID=UPI0035230F68
MVQTLKNNKYKKYSEMNNSEKQLVFKFINSNNKDITSICKLDEMFCGKIYDKGNGAIFCFNDQEVIGKVAVVLECITPLRTSFIHGIEIKEEFKENIDILMELIYEGKKVAIEYGAKSIKLGIRDEKTLINLKKVGINTEYSAIKMNLVDRSIKEKILNLERLTQENSRKYKEIFNDSFSDMPHGTWLDDEKLNEYLNCEEENEYYFMVKDDDNIIGFMNSVIENDEGMFDIGLCKQYRRKGFGKRLLETAIYFLNSKNVEKISLIVIEKNKVAHEMYKKRGFYKENTISYWIEL